MAKPKPELIYPTLAREAWKMAKGVRNASYSQYILLHYRATGSLVPGCDARDLFAWYDQNSVGPLS